MRIETLTACDFADLTLRIIDPRNNYCERCPNRTQKFVNSILNSHYHKHERGKFKTEVRTVALYRNSMKPTCTLQYADVHFCGKRIDRRASDFQLH